MKRATMYHTSGHAKMTHTLKDKITSSEYQNLSEADKNKYSRFSGNNEVYYILNPSHTK